MLRVVLLVSAMLLGNLVFAANHPNRDWGISYSSAFYQLDNTTNDGDTTLGLAGSVLRNFGHFEAGLGATINSQAGSSTGDSQYGVVIVAYDFIENVTGNDLIPYLQATASQGISQNASRSATQAGTLGMKWFPFSELFAVNAGLTYSHGTSAANPESRNTYLLAGWSLYF